MYRLQQQYVKSNDYVQTTGATYLSRLMMRILERQKPTSYSGFCHLVNSAQSFVEPVLYTNDLNHLNKSIEVFITKLQTFIIHSARKQF